MNDDAPDDATPIPHNGESAAPIDDGARMRAWLKLVGFTAPEIAEILTANIESGAVAWAAIGRLAERVGAMEAYLRAKIASDSNRIVKPWKH